MAPRFVLDELLRGVARGDVRSGSLLVVLAAEERDAFEHQVAGLFADATCELDAFGDGLEIALGCAGRSVAEVLEVDVWHVARISRAKRDRAGRVARVRLEDGPR